MSQNLPDIKLDPVVRFLVWIYGKYEVTLFVAITTSSTLTWSGSVC